MWLNSRRLLTAASPPNLIGNTNTSTLPSRNARHTEKQVYGGKAEYHVQYTSTLALAMDTHIDTIIFNNNHLKSAPSIVPYTDRGRGRGQNAEKIYIEKPDRTVLSNVQCSCCYYMSRALRPLTIRTTTIALTT